MFHYHTNGLFFDLKLLKIASILMFYFLNNDIPEERKGISRLNVTIHNYETSSSQIFHVMKTRSSKFGINTLTYEGAKMWSQFFLTLSSMN